mmetsp:Transcript_57151/g.148791  ORF Transcript_57151/g.148791 Transcript_57151/m.148791 type:complete len:531 (+) Transcript_57151:59-1651(+)
MIPGTCDDCKWRSHVAPLLPSLPEEVAGEQAARDSWSAKIVGKWEVPGCKLRDGGSGDISCSADLVRVPTIEVIGKSLIGKGSFAEVWLARTSAHPHRVAAKVLRHGHLESTQQATQPPQALQHEFELLRAVQGQENIIKVFGLCQFEKKEANVLEPSLQLAAELPSRWCLLTEFAAEGNLQDAVLRWGKMTERASRCAMKAILKALAHIHACGIIHRDINPENILLRGDGSPVIADFGRSCRLSDQENCMTISGTPGYIPPEVCSGQGWREASDLFSAGALLCFLLAGHNSFQGKDNTETAQRTVACRLNMRTLMNLGKASLECNDFVMALLSAEPNCRPCAKEALRNVWFSKRGPAPIKCLSGEEPKRSHSSPLSARTVDQQDQQNLGRAEKHSLRRFSSPGRLAAMPHELRDEPEIRASQITSCEAGDRGVEGITEGKPWGQRSRIAVGTKAGLLPRLGLKRFLPRFSKLSSVAPKCEEADSPCAGSTAKQPEATEFLPCIPGPGCRAPCSGAPTQVATRQSVRRMK